MCHPPQVSWVNMPPAQGPALSDAFFTDTKQGRHSPLQHATQVSVMRQITLPFFFFFSEVQFPKKKKKTQINHFCFNVASKVKVIQI